MMLLLLSASVSGCGGGNTGAAQRRFTAGDTVVVENLRPVVADTLTPREVDRYGRADGPIDYLFEQIFSFAVDDEGEVFVQDRSGGVREFARDGKFVRYVARRGKGPEEVEYASTMDAKGSDTLALVDLGNARVSVFGGHSAPWLTQMPKGFPARLQGGLSFHDDGTLWIAITPPFPASGGIPFPRPAFARLRDDGALVDTVFAPASAITNCPTLSDASNRAGFWEDQRDPFVPKVKWALGPGGTFVVGCPASYTFTIRSRSGELTRVVRAWSPIEVSREERDFRDRMPVPHAEATLPAYTKITVPGDGRIWVWPRQPDVKTALPREVAERFGVRYTWGVSSHGVFDVFDTRGRWLAVVRLPEEARYSGYPTEPNVVIRGDTLWAVAQDANDVEYVVRYEVPQLDSVG